MPIFNSANKFYVGNQQVTKAFLGAKQVWPNTNNPVDKPAAYTSADMTTSEGGAEGVGPHPVIASHGTVSVTTESQHVHSGAAAFLLSATGSGPIQFHSPQPTKTLNVPTGYRPRRVRFSFYVRIADGSAGLGLRPFLDVFTSTDSWITRFVPNTFTNVSPGGGHVQLLYETPDGMWPETGIRYQAGVQGQDSAPVAGWQVAIDSGQVDVTATTAISTGGDTDPGVRIAVDDPFISTSVWNLPVSNSATYEDNSGPMTQNLRNAQPNKWVNYGSYSHPITDFTKDSDPLASVTDTNDSSRSASYRIPTDAIIAPGTDKHMHVVVPAPTRAEIRYLHETWLVQKQSDTAYTAGRHQLVDLKGDGHGPTNGVRAYGGSAIGGLIRRHEVNPAHPKFKTTGEVVNGFKVPLIEHAIAMAIAHNQLKYTTTLDISGSEYNNYYQDDVLQSFPGWGTRSRRGFMKSQGYVFPATEHDWSARSNYTGPIPMGSYIVFDKNVNPASLGLTAAGLGLARAFQDYGGYITDTTGPTTTTLCFVEPLAAGAPKDGVDTFVDQLINAPVWDAKDLKTIIQYLRIVTNNTVTTPNGGTIDSTRRKPLKANLS